MRGGDRAAVCDVGECGGFDGGSRRRVGGGGGGLGAESGAGGRGSAGAVAEDGGVWGWEVVGGLYT